ncbi:HEPN domain-containing protein, partial [Enterobacter sp. 296B2]|uniref:HEPN domain-containing protein n=1 Tax=Enterobacter sp. 296B2 TaxID=3077765 RepID=UPI002A7F55B7
SSIYYLLQKIFFYDLSDGVVKDSSYLTNYFELFDLRNKEFDVYFKCSNATGDLEGGFDIFSISYVTEPQPKYGLKVERKFFKSEDVKYILCSKVRALDYMHAVFLARAKLSKISNIFSFMHHKSKFWYSNDCLIYNKNKEHVKLLSLPANIMSKTADVGIDYAKKNLGVFLRGFRMSNHSFERFNQSIELHALALKTESLSAQLLNLWICIESLLVTGKGSHVGEVENYLTHIICNDYFASKLEDLDSYLLNWNKDFYESLLERVDKTDNAHNVKLAQLLCFKEHEPLLKEIGQELSLGSPSPLLLNKLWEASKLLRSVGHIKEIRKKIKEKIRFDIKRIYLIRNEIVHQGEVKARDNLVEIAHYYLDSILNTIVVKSFERRREIKDFLYEQKMISEEYDRILAGLKDDEVIDKANYKRIIFSPDYNLYFN